MWLDLDRTCDEIARFSRTDAEAYRRLIARVRRGQGDLRPCAGHAARLRPVARGDVARAPARAHLAAPQRAQCVGRDQARVRGPPRAGIHDLAGVPDARAAWTRPGSGVLAYSIIFGRQGRSWSVPRGGSGALHRGAHALPRGSRRDRALRPAGVSRSCSMTGAAPVSRPTTASAIWRARAVLSTIHVKHLVEMAPREAWGEEFVYGVDTYDVGMSGMACYLATDAAPKFQTPDGPRSAVSAGTVGWPEDVLALGRAVRDGRPFDEGVPWLLVATPTLVDPDRAPEGHHTVKLLSPQTWDLPEGVASWEDHKETIFRRQLEHVRRFVPALSGRAHPHLLREEPGGHRALEPAHGARCLPRRRPQLRVHRDELRPVPGWADHRMPIPGSTKRAERRAWAARSPACPAATRQW